MRTPFRQGVIFDTMQAMEWWKIKELARKIGCTNGAISKALHVMKNDRVVEFSGQALQQRRYRIKAGAERPIDRRGAERAAGSVRKPYGIAPSHNFERPMLDIVWPYPYGKQGISVTLDSRTPEVCPQNTQAAE